MILNIEIPSLELIIFLITSNVITIFKRWKISINAQSFEIPYFSYVKDSFILSRSWKSQYSLHTHTYIHIHVQENKT